VHDSPRQATRHDRLEAATSARKEQARPSDPDDHMHYEFNLVRPENAGPTILDITCHNWPSALLYFAIPAIGATPAGRR